MLRSLVCCLALFAFTANARAGELDRELAPNKPAATAAVTPVSTTAGTELDRESPQQDFYRHGWGWGGWGGWGRGGWGWGGWGSVGWGYRPFWGGYSFYRPYFYSPFAYRSFYTGFSSWYGFSSPFGCSPFISYGWYW